MEQEQGQVNFLPDSCMYKVQESSLIYWVFISEPPHRTPSFFGKKDF